MTIKEYRDLKLPSYSLLSRLSQHPKLAKAMIDGEQIKSKFMDLGSLIDMLLTAPEEVKNNYYIVQGSLPTNSYMELVTEYIRLRELYLQEFENYDFFDDDSTVLKARENVGFQAGWKSDTVIKNFHDNCNHYLSEYQEAGDKSMINQLDYQSAKNVAISVLENEFTKKYFTKAEGVEIHYQYPIICNMGGHQVKTLLDILYIDHNKKEVEVIDIKTFSETLSFTKSYLKYKYYIQGALYHRSVLISLFTIGNLTEYKLLPFKFLAIDTSGFESPMLHEISSIDLKAATTGGLIGSYTVKGYIRLLEEYKWHLENNKWEYPKEVYDTGVKLISF